MKKRLLILVISLNLSMSLLFGQGYDVSISYPALTYSSLYKGVSSRIDDKAFYNLGLGIDVDFKYSKSFFIKNRIAFYNTQSFSKKTGVSLVNFTNNFFIDCLIMNVAYGGIGIGVNNYTRIPFKSILLPSFSANSGVIIKNKYFIDLVYNHTYLDENNKYYGSLIFTLGYKFKRSNL